MSKNKVYIKMNEEIKKALIVKGHEEVSKNVIQFLNEKGERFHFNQESGKYHINSFYPTIPSTT